MKFFKTSPCNTLVLSGPCGSGKLTTLRWVAGLLKAEVVECSVDGVWSEERHHAEMRKLQDVDLLGPNLNVFISAELVTTYDVWHSTPVKKVLIVSDVPGRLAHQPSTMVVRFYPFSTTALRQIGHYMGKDASVVTWALEKSPFTLSHFHTLFFF